MAVGGHRQHRAFGIELFKANPAEGITTDLRCYAADVVQQRCFVGGPQQCPVAGREQPQGPIGPLELVLDGFLLLHGGSRAQFVDVLSAR